MNDIQIKLEVADKALTRNLGWIRAADAKVPSIFAISTAMLGVLAALLPPVHSQWTVVVAIISFLAAAALIVSIVCLACASFPRLKGPKGSIVYFGGAITRAESDYIKCLSAGVTVELIEDIARQAYRNAEIAAEKFKAVKWAMILLFASIPLWLVSVAMLYSIRITSAIP